MEEAVQEHIETISSTLDLTWEESRCFQYADREECIPVFEKISYSLLSFPPEIREKIALELDFLSLRSLCQVSRELRSLCETEVFWKRKFQKDFGKKKKIHPKLSWKENYFPFGISEAKKQLWENFSLAELVILASNKNLSTYPHTKLFSKLSKHFSLGEIYRLFEEMIPVPFPTSEGIQEIRMERNVKILPNLGHALETPWIALPSEIQFFPDLEVVHLNHHQLRELPPEIGALTSLRELQLENNFLTTFPPEIGMLRNLQLLNAENNRITELPPEIGQLTALKDLDLNYNQIRVLPPEIAHLSSLKYLYLAHNQLQEWPTILETFLPTRLNLDIRDNPFGEIPEGIQFLSPSPFG